MTRRALQELPNAWGRGGRQLAGLPDGAVAHAVARLAADRPLLVVVPDEDTSDGLAASLRFYLGSGAVQLFPADDSRPYDGLSPHPAIPRARLLAMAALAAGRGVVVASASALLHRVLPIHHVTRSLKLAADLELPPERLAHGLLELAYHAVDRVIDEGTFRLRGDRLDVWPTGTGAPVRVEFFGDEIESIRAFDPDSGRSEAQLQSVELLPAGEVVVSREALNRASGTLAKRVEELGYGHTERREFLRELRDGLRFPGIEGWLGALHDLYPLMELAHESVGVVAIDPPAIHRAAEKFHTAAVNRYNALTRADRPLVSPESRYLHFSDLEGIGELEILPVALDGAWDFACRDNSSLRPAGGELARAAGRIASWLHDDWQVGMVVESSLRAERIAQLFAPHGVTCQRSEEHNPDLWPAGSLQLIRGELAAGFHSEEARLAVLTADEVFGKKVRVRRASRKFTEVVKQAGVQSFSQLQPGDFVVHRLHGIGRFLSVSVVDLGGTAQEMVQLEYRGGDRLYIPAHKLGELARYRAAGEGREPTLDRLGGETWGARKKKVRDAMLRFAHELLEMQARREIASGHAYRGKSNAFREFEEAFPYQETPDQAAAIVDVLEDLASDEAMDRLIVGDVGFGKTEVAMRAAMRVVEEGRQVVLLCPTTVLAFQHHRAFVERFKGFDVNIELLSRFRSDREKKAVRAGLKSGEVQIVVGTTGTVSRSVRFADLGLVVVDEEHRFGVKQKEALKKYRENVDYLALSATPIPRSLHMALSELRKFSVVATPPRDRLPIRTAVAPFSISRVREDLMHELRRGGQAFFVHNRVATIHSVAERVRTAVPEAVVAVAHGQMEPAELERVLVEFIEGKAQVLVCTAIIESGVDISNVNTILVNRADKFGLAQLYQLRGRVGRSHLRGYCTLLLEEGASITKEAGRRLRVLQENTALGSGFAIASADLEIRGAGDLLGQRQHGQIQSVGFETYLELLEEAIATARGEAHRVQLDPEVELPGAAFFPEEYIEGVQERLGLYKELSAAHTVEGVRELSRRIEDQYGTLPMEALGLLRVAEVKAGCRELSLASLHWLKVRLMVEFDEVPKGLGELVERHRGRMRLTDATHLEVRFSAEEAKHPHVFVHWLFQLLRALGPRPR